MPDEPGDPLLRLAVQRGLLSPELAARCAQAAAQGGRSPQSLLRERRVLDPQALAALERELAGLPTLLPADEAGTAAPAGNATFMTWAGSPTTPEGSPTAATCAPTRADADGPGPAPGEPARPGEVLGGFELLEQLGAGGMGVVFRARELATRREVALKLLPPAAARGHAAGRFAREAGIATRLQHPHVVSTLAAGADPATARLFIAMELVTGGDAERLACSQGGRLSEVRALEVVRDCARGLVALEEAGLVHRDIKPENVFLAPDGAAKLGDLGLARLQSGDDRLTATGTVVGTPCYMSPEQALGEVQVDVRSDVYGLGATLFRLISGARPFEGGSVPRILNRIVTEPAPELSGLARDVTPATAALVARAMAKSPADRPQRARALLEELEAALAAARGRAPAAPRAPAVAGGGAPAAPPVPAASPVGGARWALLGLLLLGLIAGALALAAWR